MKKFKFFLLAALFYMIAALIITSCTPQKKLARLVRKYPELIKTDTINIKDTIYYNTERVFKDSVFLISKIQNDTVIIRENNLTIRSYIYGDTMYLSGECDTIRDTIVRSIDVPYPVIEYHDHPFTKNYFKWLFVIAGSLIIYFLFDKLLGKIFKN